MDQVNQFNDFEHELYGDINTKEKNYFENDESEEDVYGDMGEYDLGTEIEKAKERNRRLEETIEKMRQEKEKLIEAMQILTTEQTNLRKNISSLYLTAKTEIARKDRIITELRTELENLKFRRMGVKPPGAQSCKENVGHIEVLREPEGIMDTSERVIETHKELPNSNDPVRSGTVNKENRIITEEHPNKEPEQESERQPYKIRRLDDNIDRSNGRDSSSNVDPDRNRYVVPNRNEGTNRQEATRSRDFDRSRSGHRSRSSGRGLNRKYDDDTYHNQYQERYQEREYRSRRDQWNDKHRSEKGQYRDPRNIQYNDRNEKDYDHDKRRRFSSRDREQDTSSQYNRRNCDRRQEPRDQPHDSVDLRDSRDRIIDPRDTKDRILDPRDSRDRIQDPRDPRDRRRDPRNQVFDSLDSRDCRLDARNQPYDPIDPKDRRSHLSEQAHDSFDQKEHIPDPRNQDLDNLDPRQRKSQPRDQIHDNLDFRDRRLDPRDHQLDPRDNKVLDRKYLGSSNSGQTRKRSRSECAPSRYRDGNDFIEKDFVANMETETKKEDEQCEPKWSNFTKISLEDYKQRVKTSGTEERDKDNDEKEITAEVTEASTATIETHVSQKQNELEEGELGSESFSDVRTTQSNCDEMSSTITTDLALTPDKSGGKTAKKKIRKKLRIVTELEQKILTPIKKWPELMQEVEHNLKKWGATVEEEEEKQIETEKTELNEGTKGSRNKIRKQADAVKKRLVIEARGSEKIMKKLGDTAESKPVEETREGESKEQKTIETAKSGRVEGAKSPVNKNRKQAETLKTKLIEESRGSENNSKKMVDTARSRVEEKTKEGGKESKEQKQVNAVKKEIVEGRKEQEYKGRKRVDLVKRRILDETEDSGNIIKKILEKARKDLLRDPKGREKEEEKLVVAVKKGLAEEKQESENNAPKKLDTVKKGLKEEAKGEKDEVKLGDAVKKELVEDKKEKGKNVPKKMDTVKKGLKDGAKGEKEEVKLVDAVKKELVEDKKEKGKNVPKKMDTVKKALNVDTKGVEMEEKPQKHPSKKEIAEQIKELEVIRKRLLDKLETKIEKSDGTERLTATSNVSSNSAQDRASSKKPFSFDLDFSLDDLHREVLDKLGESSIADTKMEIAPAETPDGGGSLKSKSDERSENNVEKIEDPQKNDSEKENSITENAQNANLTVVKPDKAKEYASSFLKQSNKNLLSDNTKTKSSKKKNDEIENKNNDLNKEKKTNTDRRKTESEKTEKIPLTENTMPAKRILRSRSVHVNNYRYLFESSEEEEEEERVLEPSKRKRSKSVSEKEMVKPEEMRAKLKNYKIPKKQQDSVAGKSANCSELIKEEPSREKPKSPSRTSPKKVTNQKKEDDKAETKEEKPARVDRRRTRSRKDKNEENQDRDKHSEDKRRKLPSRSSKRKLSEVVPDKKEVQKRKRRSPSVKQESDEKPAQDSEKIEEPIQVKEVTRKKMEVKKTESPIPSNMAPLSTVEAIRSILNGTTMEPKEDGATTSEPNTKGIEVEESQENKVKSCEKIKLLSVVTVVPPHLSPNGTNISSTTFHEDPGLRASISPSTVNNQAVPSTHWDNEMERDTLVPPNSTTNQEPSFTGTNTSHHSGTASDKEMKCDAIEIVKNANEYEEKVLSEENYEIIDVTSAKQAQEPILHGSSTVVIDNNISGNITHIFDNLIDIDKIVSIEILSTLKEIDPSILAAATNKNDGDRSGTAVAVLHNEKDQSVDEMEQIRNEIMRTTEVGLDSGPSDVKVANQSLSTSKSAEEEDKQIKKSKVALNSSHSDVEEATQDSSSSTSVTVKDKEKERSDRSGSTDSIDVTVKRISRSGNNRKPAEVKELRKSKRLEKLNEENNSEDNSFKTKIRSSENEDTQFSETTNETLMNDDGQTENSHEFLAKQSCSRTRNEYSENQNTQNDVLMKNNTQSENALVEQPCSLADNESSQNDDTKKSMKKNRSPVENSDIEYENSEDDDTPSSRQKETLTKSKSMSDKSFQSQFDSFVKNKSWQEDELIEENEELTNTKTLSENSGDSLKRQQSSLEKNKPSPSNNTHSSKKANESTIPPTEISKSSETQPCSFANILKKNGPVVKTAKFADAEKIENLHLGLTHDGQIPLFSSIEDNNFEELHEAVDNLLVAMRLSDDRQETVPEPKNVDSKLGDGSNESLTFENFLSKASSTPLTSNVVSRVSASGGVEENSGGVSKTILFSTSAQVEAKSDVSNITAKQGAVQGASAMKPTSNSKPLRRRRCRMVRIA